jgi:hypothetical protein
MLEDPARHERVGEGGDAVAAAAARGAAQHVDREGPLEELGPALALRLGAWVGFGVGFGLADAWRGTGPGGGPGGGDGAAGDDGIAQGRGGGEDAEVGPLVLARVGDQGDEGGVVRDSCYDPVLLSRSPSRSSGSAGWIPARLPVDKRSKLPLGGAADLGGMAEREEKGGAWTAPAEGPAKGRGRLLVSERFDWNRIAEKLLQLMQWVTVGGSVPGDIQLDVT